ncbi:hypothetical protein [Bacillus pretiosus]|uniref:hypothetical protein n=1 Tax=Bacillus TaxID=1386 RepID=UPI003D6594C3
MLSIVKTKKYITNPNLLVVQSKLYSPSYAGPGKWIIYNPENKKAFLAVGKDTLPDVIPILVEASKTPILESEISNGKFKRMYEAGLLVENDIQDETAANFISSYHRAVYNFPFRDYYDENWLKKDQQTMDHYSKLWNHPPMITKREGERIFLPTVNNKEIIKTDNKINIEFISSILKNTFGVIEPIKGYPLSSYRKISPSGGAKHPTEAVLILPEKYDYIEKGIYVYDVENHALIKEEGYSIEDLKNIRKNTIGILLRNRVERPMWRYREIRSYRAVMIDTGHVMENLRQISEYSGLYTRIINPLKKNLNDVSWLREPEMSLLLIGSKQGDLQEIKVNDNYGEGFFDSKRNITNPVLFFSFNKGKLLCHTLWPKVNRFSISYRDFEMLTHCLPSRRGDRDVTDSGIIKEFQGSYQDFKILKEKLAVIPEVISKKIYAELPLWINHNWYLNFLAHCEINFMINDFKSEEMRRIPIVQNINSLFKRKTTRDFNQNQITKLQFEKILNQALVGNEKDSSIELLINIKNVEDISSGLYKYNNVEKELIKLGDKLEYSQIRSMIIGQEWAGSGALDIWISKRVNLCKPYLYEKDIMELGEIGQRICIICTEWNLGIFTTPAVKDDEAFELLKIDNNREETVLYYLTIGFKEA